MDEILVHHGVLGQKWGIRRYQNEDGTLTPAGKERVRSKFSKGAKKLAKYDAKLQNLNSHKNYLDQEVRKYEYKAKRPKRLLETWKGYEKEIAKANSKLSSFENKYRNADWKAEKTYNKASNWVKKMGKNFDGIDLSSVDEKELAYVKEFISAVAEDRRRPSHSQHRR